MVTPWTSKERELVDWFLNKKFPEGKFDLDGCRHVNVPEKFFDSIRMEIARGAGSPANRTGALMSDLRLLYKQFGEE